LITVIVFLILWVAAVYFSKPKIELDLTQRNQAALNAVFSGRDEILSGELKQELVNTDPDKTTQNIRGVRHVDSRVPTKNIPIVIPISPADPKKNQVA